MSCRAAKFRLLGALLGIALVAEAANYVLDAAGSPISGGFNTIGALFSVTNKADGFVWANPTNGGGSTIQVVSVTQTDALSLVATLKAPPGTTQFTMLCQLIPGSGQLLVTLSNPSLSVSSGLQYPYSFFAAGQSNASWAVVPLSGEPFLT
jgi:hypothetical protein